MNSFSPKNKFSANVTFDKYVKGIGNCVTVTADTAEDAECFAYEAMKDAKVKSAQIVIKKNIESYPKFKWLIVKKIKIENKF